MQKGSEKRNSVRSTFARILGHTYFFYFLVAVCVVQAIWYAVSYVPSIFDEAYHVGVIRLYANQFSPIIHVQGSEWDYLGAVTRSSSYLYHYVLSYPLRFIELFTNNQTIHVLFLRSINIGIFVTGLVIFRKIFTDFTRVHRSVINLTLLFFVMTPMVAPLVGAVNYDNMVFLLFSVALWLALKAINKPNIVYLSWLLVIGLMGILVKFYFLGLFAPLLIYVIYSLLRNEGSKTLYSLKIQFAKASWFFKISIVGLLLLLTGLLIERPVMNFVQFGAFEPKCEQVLSKERCKANLTAARNMEALENRDPNFKPKSLVGYSAKIWSPIIVRTQVNILYWKKALPVINALYLLFAVATIFLIALHIKYILRNGTYRLFIILIASYTLILLLYLYKSYVTYAEPVAISSRYLIPIMPLFMFFTAHLTTKFLRNFPKMLVGVFIVTFFLFLQGGGMTSFVANNDESLMWKNNTVVKMNKKAKMFVESILII
ncbi:MAG: hypothetical protein QG628_200 [Patescibacteria group bacterium]|nr:hypothetical protein [Patescibacteria group bacterium]